MIESWNDLNTALLDAGVKLFVSMLCGLALGWERERRSKPAGLRTITLITVGSTLFMIVSLLIPYAGDWPDEVTQADPTRIASQVVTGIGFLGAGSIIRSRGDVHGLTTAATIWVSAGIGLTVGIGFPLLAMAITLLVVTVLIVLDPIGRWISRGGETRTLELYCRRDSLTLSRLEALLAQHHVRRKDIEIRPESDQIARVTVTYPVSSDDSHTLLLEYVSRIDGVQGIPESPTNGG